MASSKTRAKHVVLDAQNRRIFVVYAGDANMVDLNVLAVSFESRTGVRARALRARLGNEPTKKPAIMVQFGQGGNVESALVTLKEMTTPELPIGVASLKIQLLICPCRYVSSRTLETEFVVGFGPDDDEAFHLRYVAAMRKVRLGQLLGEDPNWPYALIMDALQSMLAGLGAFATSLELSPTRDTRPCKHPK